MKRIFWGLSILIVGVLFLLGNIGVIDLDGKSLFGTFWPLILVYIGVDNLFDAFDNKKKRFDLSDFAVGCIFLTIGGLLITNNLDITNIDVWKLIIPSALIFIGVGIMFGNKNIKVRSVVINGGGKGAVKKDIESKFDQDSARNSVTIDVNPSDSNSGDS